MSLPRVGISIPMKASYSHDSHGIGSLEVVHIIRQRPMLVNVRYFEKVTAMRRRSAALTSFGTRNQTRKVYICFWGVSIWLTVAADDTHWSCFGLPVFH